MCGLFKKRGAVGLELDSVEARAVELRGSPASPWLACWGRAPLPPGAVSDGMVLQPEAVAGVLGKLWSRTGMGSREVILGLFNQAVLVRMATFPEVQAGKVDRMVRLQAQEHIPVPLSTVVLDHAVIGKAPGDLGNVLEVLLVAARRDMLKSFLAALDAARLKPLEIDVAPLALIRNLPPGASRGTVAILDVAVGFSNLLVVSRNAPRLVRLLPVGLQGAADLLGCTPDDLAPVPGHGDLREKSPKAGGYSQPGPGLLPEAAQTPARTLEGGPHAGPDLGRERPDDALSAWVRSLEGEIRSSIGYYLSQPGSAPVEGLVLSGRGARLEGLAAHLQRRLNIPVDVMQPLRGIKHREDLPGFPAAPDFSVSVGLARRGLEG